MAVARLVPSRPVHCRAMPSSLSFCPSHPIPSHPMPSRPVPSRPMTCRADVCLLLSMSMSTSTRRTPSWTRRLISWIEGAVRREKKLKVLSMGTRLPLGTRTTQQHSTQRSAALRCNAAADSFLVPLVLPTECCVSSFDSIRFDSRVLIR